MEQQAHFLTFSTPDLDAAREFYVGALGWTPALDVPGEILFFQVAPGLLLGLFDAAKFDEDRGGPGEPRPVSGVTLAHNVGSPAAVEALVTTMAEAGASILKPPQAGAFGGVFHGLVRDPNGIVWEIAHNPGWRICEDGTVQLS